MEPVKDKDEVKVFEMGVVEFFEFLIFCFRLIVEKRFVECLDEMVVVDF